MLTETLGRPVDYRPIPLGEAREGLATFGLEPYQAGHSLSLFANINAGLMEARDTDLTGLLKTEPRSVRDLLVKAVGYRSRPDTARPLQTTSSATAPNAS
ncbi:Rossmann-fold NAD(P)-binding domain-containing protein [Actinomadura napierensis]|uniref:hypothetical protein n=1 Tax=Actinomadura napierensis TaxID=267854 RepID=UPI0031DB176D